MRASLFLRPCVILLLSAAAIFAACSEHVPPSLERAEAGAPPPPWGLDTRPVSATCKPPVVTPPTAKISFERISPIAFAHPTGVVEHDGKLYILQQGSSGTTGTVNAMVRVLGADTTQAPVVIDVSS